jgi:oxygen-independent coproporphyrinogen-3 oxidase
VEHVSAYTLTIEPGTAFARRGVTVLEEDEQRGFDVTAERLAAHGFGRYEVSNYARPGARSRHNVAYWTNQTYLGLGPGASGHYPLAGGLTTRRTNPHLHDWLTGEAGEPDVITPEDYVTDALFMGLRLVDGVDLADLTRRAGLDVRVRYAESLREEIGRGRLTLDGDRLRVTDEGRWLLNDVVRTFLADEGE